MQIQRNPQISEFYQYFTKLNFITDLDEHKQSVKFNQETDYNRSIKVNELIESVPLRFSSQANYIRLWETLFLYEAKGQVLRAKIQESTAPEAIQFINLTNMNQYKLMSFQKLNPSATTYSLGSLVVISPIKAIKDEQYPHLIGFIESTEGIVVRVFLNEQQKGQSWQLLTTSKLWYIQGICPMTTLEREYKALKGFGKIRNKIKQIILRPDDHAQEMEKKFRIPQKLDKKLKENYNQSQYKAICECLKEEGITLIQGPPGTGKTKTVLGTLSVLFNSQYKSEEEDQPLLLNWLKSQEIRKNKKNLNPWNRPDWKDWRDQPFLQQTSEFLALTKKYKKSDETDRRIIMIEKNQAIATPGKVAVCGPSNASVDQIIRKLLSDRLFDESGLSFLPNFVRVGDNFDPTLEEHSLDYIANKIMKREKNNQINEIKHRILKDYRLVFGTLSSIGNQMIESAGIQFDTVVIDQAGQSIEISNLIPLMYGCKRIILIGDPNQLPATIFSKKCLELNYDQSLFERMMKSDYPVLVLKTQYRMTPEISQVIGTHFYGGLLNNDPSMVTPPNIAFPHSFLIFHLEKSAESSYRNSYRNIYEAKVVRMLVDYISKNYGDIGVISPYSQQVSYIQSLGVGKISEVKTIDSFQGRQKTVIVFSAVRSRFVGIKMKPNTKKTIGFVSDVRRINVSLSRAKHLCIIVGDIKRLSTNAVWDKIITNAMAKGQVYQIQDRKEFFKDFRANFDKFKITEIQHNKSKQSK